MSGEAPAGWERIHFTGLLGQSWAAAGQIAAASAASSSVRDRFFMIASLSQFYDLLRKPVQLLRHARFSYQEIVAAPAVGALGDVGRVAHHVRVLQDRHGLVVADERPLDHIVALAVGVQALFLGTPVLLHEGVVLGEDLAALRAGLH